MAIKERGVVVVANKTTTGLRGRLKPSPSPFRGLYYGRLTATDIRLMTFGESQKSISRAFLALCQCPVMKFCATGAWSLSLSAGAGSYTLPTIPRGGEGVTIIFDGNEPIKLSNQTIKPEKLINRFALPL